MSRDFEKFNMVLDDYMPSRGEGNTMASQIATAVAKIVYRWFNDGDTVSSKWMVEGSTDEGGVSQYANWLFKNVKEAAFLHNWIDKFNYKSVSRSEYEDFLYDMCVELLDPEILEKYDSEWAVDSIYEVGKYANGVFQSEEEYEDGTEEDDW